MKPVKFILMILVSGSVWGQNLIPNPSFEEMEYCPGNGAGYLHLLHGWTSPLYHSLFLPPNHPNDTNNSGSCDLFSFCVTNQTTVPDNGAGYQFPSYGNSYIGQGFYKGNNESPYREILQIQLSDKLKSGEKYRFRIELSLADGYNAAHKHFGLHLSANRQIILEDQNMGVPDFKDEVMIIEHNDFVKDKEGWTVVSTEFMANGGEQWLIFGPVIWDSIPFLPVDSPDINGNYYSYYYSDNIALYPIESEAHQISAGNDRILCSSVNEQTILGSPAREQYHYFWLSLQGDTLGNTAQLTVNPTQTTTYILSQWDFKFDQTWDTVTVFVEPNCPELWLPTWFAPTQSQYWHPQWRDIEYWEVTVYNSLGQLVHRYTGAPEQHPGWDGTSIAAGVYHAVVNARAYNGEQLRAVEKVMVLH